MERNLPLPRSTLHNTIYLPISLLTMRARASRNLRLLRVVAYLRKFLCPRTERGMGQTPYLAIAFPGSVFVTGLAQLVQGVERLNHSRIDVQNAGSVNELCVLHTRM